MQLLVECMGPTKSWAEATYRSNDAFFAWCSTISRHASRVTVATFILHTSESYPPNIQRLLAL